MQPTLTLHCPKLVWNIEIRISCDVRVYTRKILRLSVLSFPPSWIWAIGVSSRSQSHKLQKWRPQSKRPCFALRLDKIIYEATLMRSNNARKYWSPTKLFVIRKIFWMYTETAFKRYTKCVAFLELNGIKKKLSSLCQILARNFFFPNSREVQNPVGAPYKRGTGASFCHSCNGSTRNV